MLVSDTILWYVEFSLVLYRMSKSMQILMNVTTILVNTLVPTMKVHLSVGVMKDTGWKEVQPALVGSTVLLDGVVFSYV